MLPNLCRMKARADLPIMTRPTLDLWEVLMRITQKETRQVMVFERERESLDLVKGMMVLGSVCVNHPKQWEHLHIRK